MGDHRHFSSSRSSDDRNRGKLEGRGIVNNSFQFLGSVQREGIEARQRGESIINRHRLLSRTVQWSVIAPLQTSMKTFDALFMSPVIENQTGGSRKTARDYVLSQGGVIARCGIEASWESRKPHDPRFFSSYRLTLLPLLSLLAANVGVNSPFRCWAIDNPPSI